MKPVIEMAREAGATPYTNRHYPDRPTHTFNVDQLERFAELVRADEREACAKLCEPKRPRPCDCDFCDCGNSGDRAAVADWDASTALTAALRARGNT